MNTTHCPVCRQRGDHYRAPRTLQEAGIAGPLSRPPKLSETVKDLAIGAISIVVILATILVAINLD